MYTTGMKIPSENWLILLSKIFITIFSSYTLIPNSK